LLLRSGNPASDSAWLRRSSGLIRPNSFLASQDCGEAH
jgi:hypothetical protein